ncbi:MAG: amidase [Rhodobacteraceae bacterium]|nr:amidase [Paracoccaceae bacterium]
MSEFLEWDAGALVGALRSGAVSAEEVMAATLARVEARNPALNAIVSRRDSDVLMAEARAADQVPVAERGALHGLPMAIKDFASVKGVPTSMGSPLFADTPAPEDDHMVAGMRAAGAIFIGKTNVPEFGLGSHTFNPVFGATFNPYDPGKSAGGSSGGAAAALAARMVALADGSDMMGSLRNPAGFCNIYGFRPSWGVVPRDAGGETFLQQISTNGPMARSPADLALLMSVIARPNPQVPHNVAVQDWTLAPRERLEGVRIGWLGDWGGAYGMEDGILSLCEAGLGAMEGLGAAVEALAPPMAAGRLWESWLTLRHWAVASELAPLHANAATRHKLKPEAIWEVEAGLGLDAMAITRAGAARARWFEKAAELFETYDVLALPTAQVWPFPVEWRWPEAIGGQAMDTYHRWMEVVVPASLAGLPAISVPVGFGDNGLPMGMQLIARKGADRALLEIAQAYHAATRWPEQRAPVFEKVDL